MPDRPLTDLQKRILLVLAGADSDYHALTSNDIGHRCGFRTGSDRIAHDGRVMGAANRVNFPMYSLRKRGLIWFSPRTDGLSGTAYRLTDAGRAAARALQADGGGVE